MSAGGTKCIPVNDLTVCSAFCCSITGWSCKWPDCWGLGVDGVFICCKSTMVCCKLMDERTNDEGKMCICSEGGCFIVSPTTCCQQQNQCCCLDTRCAMPCTEKVPMICTCLPCCVLYPKVGCCMKVKDIKEVPEALCEQSAKRAKDLSDVPVGKVRVCEACCCSICGIMAEYPACCGVKTEGICLCLQCEESCCKPIKEENEDKICFICCDGGQYIVMPSTCISVTETCFCLDSRCAFPCTDKVPCILTCLPGCVVCASKEMKMACFPLVEDIVPSTKITPEVAPAQKEMH